MGRSDLLRVQDVRDAYRLIGECRDLGRDPALWLVHLLKGICRLIGATAATGGEGLAAGPGRTVVPLSSFQSGLDAAGRRALTAYMRADGPAINPFFRAVPRRPEKAITRTRSQVVADAVYYRSPVFDRYLRPAGADHRLVSVYQAATGDAISVIHLQRASGERDFSPREQRLLGFLHGELGPLVRRQLVSATEPGLGGLSPRLSQTLACLAEGDTEKQVAARLGVSPATAHEYVTALYRRFGVHGRGELLALVLRRAGRAEWVGLAGSVAKRPD